MSRLRSYAQLVRLPNLPTALADICLGTLAVLAQAPPEGGVGVLLPRFGLLLLASGCLYSGGMVWNDYFDREQDRRERPFRPIPSGRVTPREAARLGAGLLAAGTGLSFLAGWVPFGLSLGLVAAILLYDGWLKRGPAGPVGMGLCRFLNVLLGLSVAGEVAPSWGMHLAGVVGLYVVGVTWLARTEARLSNRGSLQGAAAVLLASLLVALPLPVLGPRRLSSPAFPYLLVALGFLVGFRVAQAIGTPTPSRVQAAVKRCLLGLVVLDAVLATALAGTVGLAILFLLVPVVALARQRWLYAT
jgi:4-hydroxybenzoate polyprenyltransferase